MANLAIFEEKLKALINGETFTDVNARVSRVCSNVDGMCNEETLAMLNIAVSDCLADDEVYLEVGTWMGRAVIAALQDNNAKALVIDPLSFDDSAIRFPINVKTYDLWDRIDFYQTTWEEYLVANKPPKIGIYFYDGDHGTLSSYNGLNGFLPYISDEAILIVDDMVMEPVSKDVDRWIEEHKSHIVFLYETPFFMGQAVIGYRR